MSHNKHNYNPNNKDPKAAADTEKAKEQQQAAQEAASDDVDVIEDVEALDSEDQTETLEGQILELNKKLEEEKNKYLLLYADFDNFRKRTLREKMDLIQSGGSDVLKSMLPVLDDVMRAVEASEKSDDIKALREGEKLVMHKFIDTLRQKNVTEIEAVGADFDPDLHEAVAKFAAGEEKKGKVIDVVQRGYMLGDKVLRFAKVVVGE